MAGVPITARAVSFEYRGANRPVPVLAGFDLDVAPGERIAVMGPSGAGKTTLLALLGGLERVQEGSIVVGTTALGALRGDALAAYRHASVGFVFQHFGLLGNLTAHENVELAMTLGAVDRRRRRGRADELLAAVGIADRADHRPAQLSGGESQRVALARALANEPPLVLADEPTGNLDGTTATVVLDLLDEIARERGVTMVTVTHDPLVASPRDADGRAPRHRSGAGMTWADAATAAFRSLARRFGRATLTVLAVALAAALLSALLIISGAARTRVLTQLSKGGPLAGIQVAPAAPAPDALDTDNPKPGRARPIAVSTIRRIERLPGVRSVVSLETTPVIVSPPDPEEDPYQDTLAGADLTHLSSLPITVVTGRTPLPGSRTEVAVTEGYLHRVGLQRADAAKVVGTELEIGAPRVFARERAGSTCEAGGPAPRSSASSPNRSSTHR